MSILASKVSPSKGDHLHLYNKDSEHNINEYFDPEGMHVCLGYDDLIKAISLIDFTRKCSPTPEQRAAMDINRERALSLSKLQLRIVDAIFTQGN